MSGDLHFHRGYSLRLQESKPLKNNGIISIPLPARLLYLVPLLHLGKANAYSHNRVYSKARRWRFLLAFRDDQLHSLAPLFPHTGKCPLTFFVPVPRDSRGALFRGVAEDGTVGSR